MAKTQQQTSTETAVENMTPEQLLAYAKELDAKNKSLEAEFLEVTGELKSQLNQAKEAVPSGTLPVLKIGQKQYRFVTSAFTMPANDTTGEPVRITAQEASKNAELCKKLVESKSGLLTEVK